jgi:hypothetical protein
MSLSRFNPFASNANTHRNSARSTRPPTYTSFASAAPTYVSDEPRTTSADDRNERASAWSARGSRAGSLDSDTVFDQAESSLVDTVNVDGPRFREFRFYAYYNLLNDRILSVYYRLFAEDGPIPSRNTVYSDDPCLGRIRADLVTPPHTALNVKKCLSGYEEIGENTPTSLFVSASNPTPMDDTGSVSILACRGPGYSPSEPMALVCKFSAKGSSPQVAPKAKGLLSRKGAMSVEIRYSKGHGLFMIAYCPDQLL